MDCDKNKKHKGCIHESKNHSLAGSHNTNRLDHVRLHTDRRTSDRADVKPACMFSTLALSSSSEAGGGAANFVARLSFSAAIILAIMPAAALSTAYLKSAHTAQTSSSKKSLFYTDGCPSAAVTQSSSTVAGYYELQSSALSCTRPGASFPAAIFDTTGRAASEVDKTESISQFVTDDSEEVPAAETGGGRCGNSAARSVRMTVTAYCRCPSCCGKHADGITASGHVIKTGDRFVAADKTIPFGTRITIPGYNNGQPVEVKDRGGAIKDDRIDVYFDDHANALAWGVKILECKVEKCL